MVISEFRVFREVDNRARDGKLIDSLQWEITALRTELRRLRTWITHLEAQRSPQA
jgi:hypothetical protein